MTVAALFQSRRRKKGSTVQGPWRVALEKLAWQRQDKTIICVLGKNAESR